MIDEQLQLFLLLALHAGGNIGISEDLLLNRARAEGWRDLTSQALAITLRDFAEKQWAIDYKPALSSKRWKATDLGISVLRSQNIVA